MKSLHKESRLLHGFSRQINSLGLGGSGPRMGHGYVVRITMVIGFVGPLRIGLWVGPLPNGRTLWLINGGDPNHVWGTLPYLGDENDLNVPPCLDTGPRSTTGSEESTQEKPQDVGRGFCNPFIRPFIGVN